MNDPADKVTATQFTFTQNNRYYLGPQSSRTIFCRETMLVCACVMMRMIKKLFKPELKFGWGKYRTNFVYWIYFNSYFTAAKYLSGRFILTLWKVSIDNHAKQVYVIKLILCHYNFITIIISSRSSLLLDVTTSNS